MQGHKDNEIRYQNVNITNYWQDKKEFIHDQIKGPYQEKRRLNKGLSQIKTNISNKELIFHMTKSDKGKKYHT